MTSQDLLDRYGAPSPWRRRALLAACGLLALVGLAWLAWTAWSHSTPAVRSELVGYDVQGPHSATAVVAVEVAEDATGVQCLLRAFSEDHAVVGEKSFPVEAGTSGEIEQTLRTERRATSVERVGCTADGQSRPR